MKLSQTDAKLFFDLMWALQFFVNQKHKIHKYFKTLDDYCECSNEEKFEVRTQLFKDVTIIDQFIKENPQNFSKDHLDIIASWKNFIHDDFQIERFLKNKAIFIQNDDEVYGVLALYQSFDEMIHKSRLPMFVKTVLLPFKGKIIYDGFFQARPIYFGGGVKRRLRETYMTAKQNNRIIESLDEDTESNNEQDEIQEKPDIDWTIELQELADIAKKLKGSAASPAIYSPAFSLIKASIAFGQKAVSSDADLDDLEQYFKKVQRAFKKTATVLDRQE